MNTPIEKRPPWVFEISLFLCLAQSLIPTEMKEFQIIDQQIW